jgi:4-hydroxybenzoate polyprenyltransferase
MSEKELVSEQTELTRGFDSRILTGALQTLHRLWESAKFSSVYVSALAMTEVAIAMMLLGLPLNPAPLVVGLVTFAVYTSDRITDVETDALSNPSKAQFIRKYERFLYPLTAIAYGGAVTIAVTGGPVALGLTLLPGAFWIFYASDYLNGLSRRFYRMKEILLLNTAIIAFAWAITITWLPFAFASEALSPATAVLFAYFFLCTFVLAEVSNVGDRDGDAKIGVDTIPVVFGTSGTRHALYLVNLLTAALLAVAVFTDLFAPLLTLPLVVTTGYSTLVVGLVGRWENVDVLAQLVEAEHFLTIALLSATGLIV